MLRRLSAAGFIVLVAAIGTRESAHCQENSIDAAVAFDRETLTLKSGKTYRGYLLSRTPHEVEFVDVGLPKGRPMFLVRISFDPQSVASYERLDDTKRRLLLDRIRPLLESKRHAVIEAGRMDDVDVSRVAAGDRQLLVCQSPFFHLVSSADDESTRRCFVRVEQVFRAFQKILPPRVESPAPLEIRLHGRVSEYRAQLRSEGIEIRNPAYYSAPRNSIVAGCDLTHFAERLLKTRQRNEQVREHYQRFDADLTNRLAALAAELKESGFNRDEIQREISARRAAWKIELESALRKVDEANRRNEAQFAEFTRQLFARLYHEAFHAYLQNYVFPESKCVVPRWLNEGLAQVFETAQLDDDRLRVDRPDPDRLRRLQEDLQGGSPLPLRRLLEAPASSFLATHDDVLTERQYLYAWGLTYYLVFHGNLLDREQLTEYVASSSNSATATERFVEMAGRPLGEFEARWRDAMLSL